MRRSARLQNLEGQGHFSVTDEAKSLARKRSLQAQSAHSQEQHLRAGDSSQSSLPPHQQQQDSAAAEVGCSQMKRTTRSQKKIETAAEAGKSAKQRAEEQGLQCEPISEASMMTGSIEIGLVKICVLQQVLRQTMKAYTLAEKTLKRLQATEPLDLDADEPKTDAAIASLPSSPHSCVRETQFPQREDAERGRQLHWSLRSREEMQRTAEYGIFLGRSSAVDDVEDPARGLIRDLLVITKWEPINYDGSGEIC